MAKFEPFRALRYATSDLGKVVAPPYDVLTLADVRHLRNLDVRNITWVDVPLEEDGDDRYRVARDRLEEWIVDGTFIRDDDRSFTIYRMIFVDASGSYRTISGVIGAIEVDDAELPVLAHERTTPKATTDRRDLLMSTETNLSSIWGLSLGVGLSDALAAPGELVGEVEIDGVHHRFERVTEEHRCAQIASIVTGSSVLIADGHHRFSISKELAPVLRASSRGAGSTMMFVNELVDEQLAIAAIHRVYRGVDAEVLRAALNECYESVGFIDRTGDIVTAMGDNNAIAYLDSEGTCELMGARVGVFDGLRDLDGLRLEYALRQVEHHVSYEHSMTEISRLLAEGDVACAVLIRPVGLNEIVRTARERELMPPKSTFFTPKLLTGPVLRPLDE